MIHFSHRLLAMCTLAALLSACSSEDAPSGNGSAQAVSVGNKIDAAGQAATSEQMGRSPADKAAPLDALPSVGSAPKAEASSTGDAKGSKIPDKEEEDVLALGGLGNLRIGRPLPRDGSWASRGAQTSDACQTVSSKAFPGVYAIVTGGKVRRITVGRNSDLKLIEGVGAGSTEKEVKRAFVGFREEPHKYQSKPAKYLTTPGADAGSPALRFEIGSDGQVTLMHVGTMPELGLVEGCS